MEKIELDNFKIYLNSLIKFYQEVDHILMISLCDIFLNENLEILKNDRLVIDTIDIMKEYNYDLEKLYNLNYPTCTNSQNLFLILSKLHHELLNDKIIEIYQNSNFNQIEDKKTRKQIIKKKSYEVDILSNFLLNKIQNENINNIIEMGCGKSYLNDYILVNDEMVYVGIDKKDELVKKMNERNKNENIISLNLNITVLNFGDVYMKEINHRLNKTQNNKVLLFGLHSCGNLTSDTVKIFTKNESISHLVVIGCCLNLLKEYISPQAKESELFKYYIKNIGYDSKGNYLEQTLLYDYDYEKIGYPLSNHIIQNHSSLYLSRTVRNSSMQSIPKKEDKIINYQNNLFYKKILFRTILQSFFEYQLPEMRNFYGYGKIKLESIDDFYIYLTNVIKNLFEILKNQPQLLYKIKKLIIEKESVNNFFNNLTHYEDLLWAVYIIRLKFSKVVEYLIAVDRIVYLKENNIEKIHLVKIFDENLSVRNLLIYASK